MIATLLSIKVSEVKNKTPNVIDLVKKCNYGTKILDIEKKYFTTADYKFTSATLDAKIKQKELLNKTNFSDLIKDSDLNTKLATLATKVELKTEQDKILKFIVINSSYFHCEHFFADDGLQNMFFISQHLIRFS